MKPFRILLGMTAGALIAILAKALNLGWLQHALLFIEPLGLIFIRLILMVVVPLVVCSLFVATASLGSGHRLAKLGSRTFTYFLLTTMIGATIGLLLALLVHPGAGLDPAIRDGLAAQFEDKANAASASVRTVSSLSQMILNIIPQNPFAAAAQMDLLPLVISTMIFGAAANFVPLERRQVVISFFEGVSEICMVIIRWVMLLAPYAVFALIAATVVRFGVELLQRLLIYCLVVFAGLMIQVFGVYTISLLTLARMKLTTFYRGVAKALLVAFSTSSSSATLPVSLEVAEKNLGISHEIASFVLPLGTTLNLNGAAVYKGVTAVFIAEVYGQTIGWSTGLTIIVAATLAAIAGVGIPGSSLVTTLIVLNAIGLGQHAVSGIALVLGVDRLLDMLRSTVNVTGTLTCAAYIAHSEKTKPPVTVKAETVAQTSA